jgi:predicted phage terminase large subunit-like protein
MDTHNLKEDDVVVIRAFEDEWPEHLFKVSGVYDDCITGHAITGPLKGVYGELRIEGLDAVAVQATQSKETRAHIQTPKFEARRVLFPQSAPWPSELEAELLAFPEGRHDDQVDPITQALAHEIFVGPGAVWI